MNINSKEMFNDILTLFDGALCVFKLNNDETFSIKFISDAIQNMVGYSINEIMQQFENDIFSVCRPEDREKTKKLYLENAYDGAQFQTRFETEFKNGVSCTIEANGIVKNVDNELRYYISFKDISEKLRIDKLLVEKEAAFQIASRNSDVNMWEYDSHTHILYNTEGSMKAHKNYVREVKNFPESIIARDFLKKESESVIRLMYQRIDNGEKNVTGDVWYRDKGTDNFWCERITLTNVFDNNAKVIHTIGIGKNITEEAVLRADKQRYDLAIENTNLIIWEYDIINHIGINHHGGGEYFNLPDRIENMPDAVIESGLIHTDDIKKFSDFYKAIDNGEERSEANVQIKIYTGEFRWFNLKLSTVYDDAGTPVRAVGCAIDITDAKEMEKLYNDEIAYQEIVTGDKLIGKVRVNLTKNIVEKSVLNGVEDANTGISYVCAYTNNIIRCVPKSYADDVRNCFDRDRLIKAFYAGEPKTSMEYMRFMGDSAIWVNTSAKVFQSPETGDIMCFIYTTDINDTKILQTTMERIAQTEFDLVMVANVKTNSCKCYGSNREYSSPHMDATDKFSQSVKDYLIKNCAENTDEIIKATSTDTIVREVNKNGEYMLFYSLLAPDNTVRRKRTRHFWIDRELGILCIIRSDVTDIYQDEQRKNEILSNALKAAEQANVAKTEFLSRMSHEIRTPMNAIIGMSALAAQCVNDPDKVSDCISKVGISARFLLTLINDILDMSRIESGKVTIKHEKIPFEEFLNGINVMCYEQAKAKNIDYDCIVSTYVHDYYIGDAMKLQQVLINIIANAIKFTPRNGKVQFIVSQEKTEDSKAAMKFTINDTGIGISEDFIDKIFEPFEQEHTGTTTLYGGTGLGLAICKNLISLMGGDITVNSIEGVGTEFNVLVNLELSDEIKKKSKARNDLNFSKLSALIVDDEIQICEQTKDILLDMGMKAEWVVSGRDAVETVQKKWDKQEFYNIILVDWKMPEMDGIETVRRIRKIVGPDVTIIIMTAYDWASIESEAKLAGVNLLMSKPVFKSSLKSTFEKIFIEKENQKQEKEPVEFDFTGKRALLVEDHILNIEVAKRLLNAKNMEIEVAENGLKAIEAFVKNGAGYYDVILMDIRMPVMDGLTASKSIRQTSQQDAKTIPIIAMSANAFDEDIEKSKSAGMNFHLAKPIEPRLLYSTLHYYLREQED